MSDSGAHRSSLAAELEDAAANGDVARARLLIEQSALVTPEAVCNAIRAASNELLVLLLSSGADPNGPDRGGVAPVFVAAAAGHPAVAAFLADPDHTDVTDRRWPAHRVTFGHGEAVWTLLSRGAAASARHVPDGRQTAAGTTPTMVAAAFGHTAALDVLMAHGANPRDVDYAGRNAHDWAKRFGQKASLERLKQFARR
jgi:ankyrin repeat protein